MANTTWVKQGLCRPVSATYDPWFSEDPEEVLTARAVCVQCPVRSQCLIYALINGFDDGIFGGLDPAEREPLRQAMFEQLGPTVIAGLEDNYLVSFPESDPQTPSVEAKYSRRLQRAEYCRNELSKMSPDTVPHYNLFAEVLDSVVQNPTATGKELGHAIGRSTAMFNQRLRECFEFFALDLSLL